MTCVARASTWCALLQDFKLTLLFDAMAVCNRLSALRSRLRALPVSDWRALAAVVSVTALLKFTRGHRASRI